MTKKLQIRLFGGFSASWSDGQPVSIRGQKQRAILAMLLTAQGKSHSRDWLHQNLWNFGDRDQGRANLRHTLYELRQCLGSNASNIICGSYIDVWLNSELVVLLGDKRDGEFLEGITIQERGFQNWLSKQRQKGVSLEIRQGSVETKTTYADHSIVPTIAILPLSLFGGDTQDAILSDLVSMEISRGLSRSNLIHAISHLSSREIDGRNISMAEVRKTLNADFVAYGSLRVDKNTFTADIDLADCKSGRLLWSRNVAASVETFFNRETQLVEEIGSEIGYAIVNSAIELAQNLPLPDLDSHRIFLSSINGMHSDRLHIFAKARAGLEHLINERGIQDSRLYAWLSHWYMLSIPQGWATSPKSEVQKALDCASRALDINPNCSLSIAMNGMAKNSPGHDFSQAFSLLSQARNIEPSNAFACLLQARLFAFQGDGKLAVEHADHALKLSPAGPQAYFFENIAATANVVGGNYDRAIELINNSLLKNAQHRSSLRVKTVAYEMSGQIDAARDTMKLLQVLDPGLTVEKYLANHPAGDLNTGFEWARSLERAGLPST